MNRKRSIKPASDSAPLLKTDYPLAEKDEQGRCIERMHRLQDEALKLWHTLKKKRK